tara:strand:- start:53 stop:442 length:390 start_codon:yes stop_codon:yes gene_type:complete
MATLKIADRRSDSIKFLENWRKRNGLPSNSKALPPVESVPTWMRGYIFPKAEGMKNNKDLMIAHNTHRANPLAITQDGQVLYGGGNHNYRQHILPDPAGNPVSIELNGKIVPYNKKNLEALQKTVKPWQ